MYDNVLVIDDDPIFGETVQTYLKQSGVADVTVIANGADALDFLVGKLEHLQFIVLDVHLPDVDGIQILRKLRDASTKIPIALVSTSPPMLDVATNLGHQYGLNMMPSQTKPLSLEDLDSWFSGCTK